MRLLLPLLAALWATPAPAEPLDRVVAVVGDQLVLSSDVRLLELLQARDPGAMPIWTPSSDRAVDVAAVRELAGDVSVYAPRPETLSARMDGVRDSFPTDDSFRKFLKDRGMSEPDLIAVMRRRLIVEQFLRRNLEASPGDASFQSAAAALFAASRERVVIRPIAPQPR